MEKRTRRGREKERLKGKRKKKVQVGREAKGESKFP